MKEHKDEYDPCPECRHSRHLAGYCNNCNCGESEIIHSRRGLLKEMIAARHVGTITTEELELLRSR